MIRNMSTSKETTDIPDRGYIILFTLGNSGQSKAFPMEILQIVLHPLEIPSLKSKIIVIFLN